MRLGHDAEVFMVGRKDNQFKSIIGKIKADKWNPKQIEGMPDGFTLQEDNVALEFGVPPAASAEEFIRNTRAILLAGLRACPGERFSKLSCTIFPKEEMKHPSAFVFGCEPDFNAWTLKENDKPEPPHPYMRSAGGHVHIETKLTKHNVVRAFDLTCVIPSMFIDKDGAKRRQMYGKPGAFRPKPYGVECRSLSNFWIFKPRHIQWVWDNSAKALEFAEHRMDEVNAYGDQIQQVVLNNDLHQAEQLVKHFNLEVV